MRFDERVSTRHQGIARPGARPHAARADRLFLHAAIYAGAAALPETLNHAAIAIVDEDRSPVSAGSGLAFTPPYFSAPRLIVAIEMDAADDAGIDTFALNIPPEFQRDLLARQVADDPAQHRCDRGSRRRSTAAAISEQIVSARSPSSWRGPRNAQAVPSRVDAAGEVQPGADEVVVRRHRRGHHLDHHALDHPDRRRADPRSASTARSSTSWSCRSRHWRSW